MANTKSNLLTADELMGRAGHLLTRVEIPQLKGHVFLRQPSAEDGIAYAALAEKSRSEGGEVNPLSPDLLAFAGRMVTDSKGNTILSADDLAHIGRIHAGALSCIITAMNEAMGLTLPGEESDSGPTEGGDSSGK